MGFNKETVPESIASARPWPYENRHWPSLDWPSDSRKMEDPWYRKYVKDASDQYRISGFDVVKNTIRTCYEYCDVVKHQSTKLVWQIVDKAVVAVHQAPGLLRTCCRKLIIPLSSKKEWPAKSHKTNRTSDGSVTAFHCPWKTAGFPWENSAF